MIRILTIVFLLAGGLCAGPDQKGASVNLSVDEVLAKMSDADGTKAAKGKLQSLRVVNSVEMSGAGMKMGVEQLSSTDASMIITTMNGRELGRQGYDGKIAWAKDIMMGLRTLEGQEKFAMLQVTLEGTLDPKTLYDEVVFGKETKFENKKVVELIGKKKGLHDTHFYVDTKTWMTIGTRGVQSGPQGEMPARMVVEEYKKLKSGLQFPSLISIESGPMKMKMKVESIEENIDLSKINFSKPQN